MTKFADLTNKVIEACSPMTRSYTRFILRLCDELPASLTRPLWGLLVRLRGKIVTTSATLALGVRSLAQARHVDLECRCVVAHERQEVLADPLSGELESVHHVVQGDPRVPRPQSEELHMALKELGVPTEFYVYPGDTHGIPDPRNQFLKATAEMMWMDYWVRGSGKKFAWRDVLKSLDDERPARDTGRVANGSNP